MALAEFPGAKLGYCGDELKKRIELVTALEDVPPPYRPAEFAVTVQLRRVLISAAPPSRYAELATKRQVIKELESAPPPA